MPGLCGRELALALRTLLPRAMIIAMSATPSPVEAYDGFVEKPLDLAALRRKTLRTSLENGTGSVDIQPAVQKNIPVLDERVHRKLQRTIPPAALAEVYEVCLKDARSRAEEMLGLLHECSEGSGFPSIRRSAHAIKGGAGMIGASMLASAAAKLELGSYMRDDVPGLINNLLHCCDQLQRILMSKSETTG
jgi:HPt (histidine-containing phosphotransfer) domain-containing protein